MSEYDYKLKAVLNTSYKPVKYRVDGRQHYQIFLHIYSEKDPDLKNVSFVEYKLHPTFKDRVRVAYSPINNFQVEIKAWGTFDVDVTVGLKDKHAPYRFTQDMKAVLEREAI